MKVALAVVLVAVMGSGAAVANDAAELTRTTTEAIVEAVENSTLCIGWYAEGASQSAAGVVAIPIDPQKRIAEPMTAAGKRLLAGEWYEAPVGAVLLASGVFYGALELDVIGRVLEVEEGDWQFLPAGVEMRLGPGIELGGGATALKIAGGYNLSHLGRGHDGGERRGLKKLLPHGYFLGGTVMQMVSW